MSYGTYEAPSTMEYGSGNHERKTTSNILKGLTVRNSAGTETFSVDGSGRTTTEILNVETFTTLKGDVAIGDSAGANVYRLVLIIVVHKRGIYGSMKTQRRL